MADPVATKVASSPYTAEIPHGDPRVKLVRNLRSSVPLPSPQGSAMRPQTNKNDLSHFFEYSGVGLQVLQDGLSQVNFGEYLVNNRAITREELFRALQLQDQNPGVRIGECLAKLGAMDYLQVELHLKDWNRMSVVEA